ncbi:condensation domain-containing protein [Bacillus subtilis]|uniref:condensation domain-containing protein n=1 Tax=Bacillus subtilis TaxID=1423 RepID=UPI0012FE1EA8|nr:condensation domain-containing protein [Bacillus subtilis]
MNNTTVLTGNAESKHITVTPYSQYIEWLLAQDEEEASRYWNEYLADYEEQTIVPNLGVHPEQEGYRSESVICELGQALTHQIQQIASSQSSNNEHSNASNMGCFITKI